MEPLPDIKFQLYNLVFNHPKESRFKQLFDELSKKRKKRKSKQVNPKNIISGLDKRTSIIIKNIPEGMSSEKFFQMLSSSCSGIDYYYNPVNIRTRKNLRVAFVNFKDCNQIVPLYMKLLYKMKFRYKDPSIHMEICYSKHQGKNRLIKRFMCDKPFAASANGGM